MKNLTIIILITLHCSLFTIHVFSQSCLPEGIIFSTQAQIDNFQTNYPNCTEIEGDVKINGDNITNLNGLYALTNFGSDLMIGNDEYPYLGFEGFDLQGLNNVIHIEGSLLIHGNDSLLNLEGLENLISIGGNLELGKAIALTAFVYNPKLNSLSGLNNLASIGGDLVLLLNTSLEDLSGLESLTTISGSLGLTWNSLTNLSGLSNITTFGGNLYVVGNNLTSLTGLEWLTSVHGDVTFMHNDCLPDFTGLDNLTLIEGSLYIEAGNTSLSGLGNLETIGGGFGISSVSLTDFSELNNLTSIGGELGIYWNEALTSLSGLENIDANSISKLTIRYNHVLSTCGVQSICNYLAAPNGTIEIHSNAPGCDSQEEVEEACGLSVDELSAINNLSIHPNPFSNTITIEFELRQPETITINIYNHLGEQVEVIAEKKSIGEQKIEWNAEGLPAGVYFCRLKTNNGMETRKMIKL